MDTTEMIWLWRMRHPTLPMEFGYRIARPLPDDDNRLCAAVTVDGRVLRSADGKGLLFPYAHRLEGLLRMGEQVKAQLRAHGFEDVEEDV